MAWVRYTDTFATHPIVLAVLEHDQADRRSVNEIAGFITRCSTEAGQHYTDYVFSFGTAITMAGGDRDYAEQLLAMAQFAGYGVYEVDDQTGRRRFRLVDDPEFIHMVTAQEKAWNDQRKADNGNPDITAPVRCRDGDVCRYCYNVVNFGARKGKLRGTYDHRPPGQPGSAKTSVVACGECNARRGDQPVEVADLELPLRPVLPETYYHPSTRKWLAGYAQILRQHGMTPPPIDPEQKGLAAGRPAPGAREALASLDASQAKAAADPAPTPGVRPAAPKAAADTAHPVPVSSSAPAGPRTPKAVRPGPSPAPREADPGRSRQTPGLQDPEAPGRDGTGRGGTPRVSTAPQRSPCSGPPSPPAPKNPPQPQDHPPRSRRRRGKRGGRPRPQGGTP